jgi:hypothetical protein
MRQDQIERLKDLSEKLADVFLEEADPAMWSGANTPSEAWTQQDRGNRVWEKKGAMATGGVLRYALDLVAKAAPAPGESKPEDAAEDSDLDKQIKEAERRATEAVNRVVSRAKQHAAG